jgi:hypothetical protein
VGRADGPEVADGNSRRGRSRARAGRVSAAEQADGRGARESKELSGTVTCATIGMSPIAACGWVVPSSYPYLIRVFCENPATPISEPASSDDPHLMFRPTLRGDHCNRLWSAVRNRLRPPSTRRNGAETTPKNIALESHKHGAHCCFSSQLDFCSETGPSCETGCDHRARCRSDAVSWHSTRLYRLIKRTSPPEEYNLWRVWISRKHPFNSISPCMCRCLPEHYLSRCCQQLPRPFWKLSRVRQTTVKRVFKDRLVPQAPTEEQARVLLETI